MALACSIIGHDDEGGNSGTRFGSVLSPLSGGAVGDTAVLTTTTAVLMTRDDEDGDGENDDVLAASLALSCSIGCDSDNGDDADDIA